MKKLIIGCFLFLFCSVSNAQVYQSGPIKVQSLRVTNNVTYVRFSPALNACEGGYHYRMHAKVNNDNTALISSLLTAYTAQKTLGYVFVSGEGKACSPSHILTLDMIEFSQQ
ncbi:MULTISPECIES: hypothetical protein [Pseudoalteromonas]|uniref:Uncharacterized protein n=1 Tax=Pseudoalteromonas rubra TaxID=43658 RepID=A0A0U2Z9I8_9GAMM|nr:MULTISPECIES: hypothetical protein [Pseudoalteromonas]ALU44529.1 hypothetical protein AT705_17270 [Pseudoalteromonas rubra]MEC4091441.1 hypothetical protein [Pseudoalteromonas rubra]